MLVVLMTAAPEGRTRPGLREAADLVGGAVRVWCQPTRRLTWRGALGMMGAGAAAGLLGGITVAAASPRPLTGVTAVEFQEPSGPQPDFVDAANRQAAIVRSQPVLAGALRAVRPAMSVQALRREVHVTLLTDQIMEISGQAPTASQAASAAAAVAVGYIAYTSRNVPPAGRPVADVWTRPRLSPSHRFSPL